MVFVIFELIEVINVDGEKIFVIQGIELSSNNYDIRGGFIVIKKGVNRYQKNGLRMSEVVCGNK